MALPSSTLSVKSSLPFKVYPGRLLHSEFVNGSVVTIGAFDGVHLGHQQIIQQLKSHSSRLGLPSIALTFRPDPSVFFGGKPVAALMNWREKMCSLSATGIDYLGCIPFDQKLSEMTPEAFVSELLVNQLGVKLIQVGDDFRFGADRQGDYELLCSLGLKYHFDVVQSATYEINEERVSSTRIRACLASANFLEAETLLGRPYQISGKVIRANSLDAHWVIRLRILL